jgi:hypothetical protein
LLVQWIERLKMFLEIDPKDIGIIGGGRRKPTGVVDVALIQSLVRRGAVSDLVADYGHVIVDECHHLSAASFELVARRSKARYVLGLSATVARKDGHHPIIFMQCGPVRFRVHARAQAAERGMAHRVEFRPTSFQLPPALAASDRPAIAAVYGAFVQDEARNDQVFDDVLTALQAKRSPVLLTERRDHLEYLQGRFSRFVRNLVVLWGGMSATTWRECLTEDCSAMAEDRTISDLSLVSVAGMSEEEARQMLMVLRWPPTGGLPTCPRCGSDTVYALGTRPFFRCRCRKNFSITSGTIFAGGAKGVSSLQLSRYLGSQYKTSFVLAHKMREAMQRPNLGLGGIVQVDGSRGWNGLANVYEVARVEHNDVYSRDGVNTNWAESYFAILRKIHYGTHHQISARHLAAYANELAWRQDHRRMDESDKVALLLMLCLNAPQSQKWRGYWQQRRIGRRSGRSDLEVAK